MTVLVLSRLFDATTDVVVDVLNRRGGAPVVRADLADLRLAARIRGARWEGRITAGHRAVDLDDISGIYYRRPTDPRAPSGTPPAFVEWTEAEQRWGVRGLLTALPRQCWFNWPPAVHAAEHKPYQLVEAVGAGLRVPDTMITDDPDEAVDFAERGVPVLYKPFRGRPIDSDDGPLLVYATEITSAQCRSESVRVAPILLQDRVDKLFDVRVTVVGDQHFAVSPRTAGSAPPLDWRVDHAANDWVRVEVPTEVAMSTTTLVSSFGLNYAACDFSVDRDGTWWFLELNPAGQWAWAHPERAAIAEALADALMRAH